LSYNPWLTKCLAFHTTTKQVSPNHTDADQGTLSLHLQSMYIPRKHKLTSALDVHKNTGFPVPSTLSPSLSNSSVVV